MQMYTGMKNSRFSTTVLSITAECSRLIVHCPKNHLASLFRDPYRYCRQKNGNTHVWNRAVPSCKFSRRSVRDICPWAKIHIFPYRGLPGATIACYTFFRSSYQAIVTPYYSTCNAVTYHVRGQNFGFLCPLGYPKGEKTHLGHMYHYAKVHADWWHQRQDICPQTDRYIQRITADLIYNEMHTNIAFVSNNNNTKMHSAVEKRWT